MIEADRRRSAMIQKILLSKNRFKSIDEAKEWVKDKGSYDLSASETAFYYAFPQRDPSFFKQDSFRTFSVAYGVSIITGLPKSRKEK